MKKLYKTIVKSSLAIISILTLESCADEFLTQENPNRPVVKFESLEQTSQTLHTLYSNLLNHNIVSPSFEALTTDLAAPLETRVPGGTPIIVDLEKNNLIINNNTETVGPRWAAMYRGIFIANQLIYGLEEIENTIINTNDKNLWTYQMAQARFFRGMYHFYLHEIYNNGSIIIKDKYISSALESSASLSSSEEVMAFYVEDLKYALENLVVNTELEDSDKGKVTKATAALVLANHYLFQEDYDSAIPLYEKLTQTTEYGEYALASPDIMFTTAGEFNSESILEVNYTTDINYEQSEWDETSFHNRFAFESSLVSATNEYLPASWLIELYQNEQANQIDDGSGLRDRTVSKRATAMVALTKDEEPAKFYDAVNSNGKANVLRYRTINGGSVELAAISMFKKYTNHDIRNSEKDTPDNNNRKSGKNVTILRLAEAYINLAECYIEQGRLQEAIDQLNVVRQRWDVIDLDINADLITGAPYTQETLREHLRNVEKPLELSIEGISTRTIDLRRWGIGQARFQELSNQVYSLEDHGTQLLASPVTNANSIIVKGTTADSEYPHVQFTEAANNYSSYGGYLPIPAEEILNNNNF